MAKGLTMAEAATLLAVGYAGSYQRYETGANRPDAPLIEHIKTVTEGAVTLDDLHDQRLEWLRANRPDAFSSSQMVAAE